MKKLLSVLFAAAMAFSLLAGCASNEDIPPVELNKVGDFASQPEDAAGAITLPQGMMGNGIKVAGLDNKNLSGEAANIPWAGEALDFYVTLYNANDYENKFTLFAIADREQAYFCVDGNSTAQPSYQVTMPPKSYTVVPVRITADQLPTSAAVHDLWFLCDGVNKVDMGDGTFKEFRNINSAKVLLDSGDAAWSAGLQSALMPEGGLEVQEMGGSFASRTSISGSLDGLFRIYADQANVKIEARGRSNGLAQTFLLVDYQTIPLTEDGDSVTWCEQTDRQGSYEHTFDAAGMEGKEIFLLTLPVGRDGMPDASERYVITKP